MGKGEKVGRSGEEGSVDSSRGGSDQRFLYFNHTINRHRSGSIQGYGRRRRPCQHIFHPPVYARPPAIQLSLHLAESLEISLISRRSILRDLGSPGLTGYINKEISLLSNLVSL